MLCFNRVGLLQYCCLTLVIACFDANLSVILLFYVGIFSAQNFKRIIDERVQRGEILIARSNHFILCS